MKDLEVNNQTIPQKAWAKFKDILALGKPRITTMVLVATAVGYVMGAGQTQNWGHLGVVILYTALLSGGVNALNQYLERNTDALMQRTKHRPLPMGKLVPKWVLVGGLISSLGGSALLAWQANLLSGLVGLVVLVSYVFCYTPLKRITPLNALVGAVPGALPPVLGYVAVVNNLTAEALALFLILFFWQMPHLLAIAYLYKEDYVKAGLRMPTVSDPSGVTAARQSVFYSIVMIPVSMLPYFLGMTGNVYLAGGVLLGLYYLAASVLMARTPSHKTSLRLLRASIIYQPALFALMIFDAPGVQFISG